MKGLSKEVKSAIIIGIVILALLILGIIYGQKEKTEVADAPTTTVSEVAEETTTAAAETTAATTVAETTTSANVTVPAGAAVTKASDGKWALVQNGSVVNAFTGIAKNDLGTWYVENGYVNFDFSGKVVFNGVTYDVENGKIVNS